MRVLLRQALPVLTALICVVLSWGLVVYLFDVPHYLLPSPAKVWQAGWADRGLILHHMSATTVIAVAGFLLGVSLGVVAATVLGLSRVLQRAVEPLLIASQAIPPVIIAPIVIAAMGFGAWPKIIVVTLGAFFPVAISTIVAILGANRAQVDLFTSMGASKLTVLRRVRLPGALPAIVSGAKISASYVVFSAIIAEWMGSSVGLGVYLQRSQASYQMDQLFAAVAVIAVLGVTLFWLSSILGKLVLLRSQIFTRHLQTERNHRENNEPHIAES